MTKFKKGLVSEVKQEIKEEAKQETLKEKYHIEDDSEKKVIVVEKSHLIIDIFKTFLNICMFILACVGIISLVYPSCRAALVVVGIQIFDQLKSYLPFLTAL